MTSGDYSEEIARSGSYDGGGGRRGGVLKVGRCDVGDATETTAVISQKSAGAGDED